MRYRLTKGAKNFARGGGYQSQIGRGTSRDSGVSASMAGTHDSLIPPLAIEYKEVERTADADFGKIALKLQEESRTKGEAAAAKAADDYMKWMADENILPHQAAGFKADLEQLQSEIRDNMAKDPMHYANGMNQQRLAASASRVVDLEKITAARNQKKAYDTSLETLKTDGSLRHIYHDEDGNTVFNQQTGKELTNQDVYEIALNPSHDLFSKIIKKNGAKDVGSFMANARSGNMVHSRDWLNNLVANIKMDASGSSYEGLAKQHIQNVDEYNNFMHTVKTDTKYSSNAAKINLLKSIIAKNWENEADPKAKEGLRQNFLQQVNGMRATDASGKVISKYSFEQEMAAAQKAGDMKTYNVLKQARDRAVHTAGENWVRSNLDLAKQTQRESATSHGFQKLENAPTQTYDTSGGGGGGGGTLPDGSLSPFGKMLTTDETTAEVEQGWFGLNQFNVPLVGKSSIPPKGGGKPQNLEIKGKYYIFERRLIDGKRAGVEGKATSTGTGSAMYENATKTGQTVRHVFRGQERVKNAKGEWVLRDVNNKDNIVTFTPDGSNGITNNSQRDTDEHGTYYLVGDPQVGYKRVYVEPQAFHEYKTANGHMLLKPMDKMESYVYFDDDFSRTTAKTEVTKTVVLPNGKKTRKIKQEALQVIKSELQSFADRIPQARNATEQKSAAFQQAYKKAVAEYSAYDAYVKKFSSGTVSSADIDGLEKYIHKIKRQQERNHILGAFPGWKAEQTMNAETIRDRWNVL